jgi:exopolysaccharide production protein ExoZ
MAICQISFIHAHCLIILFDEGEKMSQLRTIQLARGIAANLVVFSHLFLVESKYMVGGGLPPFTLYGISGVELFFVLSGFIMVAVAA